MDNIHSQQQFISIILLPMLRLLSKVLKNDEDTIYACYMTQFSEVFP